MPLAAWRENSSRHVASLRRIRLLFFIAPVSSTITGRDYPQWTDLRKYVAELPVTFDLAIDDMGKPDGANLQFHCCSEFLVSAQMPCPYRFSHSCLDLVLPGDADFFQEFTDASVELLFVHGSLTPVLNLFILANSPPAHTATSRP